MSTSVIGKVPLPPPSILQNETALDAWYLNLSPVNRGRFAQHFNQLIDAMPPRRRALFEHLMDAKTATAVSNGLGWVGAVIGAGIGAATSAGVSIYNGKQQANLTRDLAKDSNLTQVLLTKLEAETQQTINATMAEAQKEAAKIAAEAQIGVAKEQAGTIIGRAQIEAQRDIVMHTQARDTSFTMQYGKWVVAGGAVLGGAIVLGLYLKKRKR